MMLISTIIPVHNGESFLADALESVVSQSYPEQEVVVVDDGSTDSSKEIALGFGVTVISISHGGVAMARNTGIEEASGSLLAFLDSDDTWEAGKLSIQFDYLSNNRGLDGVFGFMRNYLHEGVARPVWLPAHRLDRDVPGHSLGTLLIRREVFGRVGLFDARIRSGEDSDWFFRARDLGVQFGMIEQRLLSRRIHSGNLSHDARSVQAGILRAVRSSITRRRRDGDNHA